MARRRSDQTVSMKTSDAVDRIARAWLIVAPGTVDERVVVVEDAPVVLGKESTCDVPIADPHVSREHCRIQITDGGIRVEDLGSRNGTLVNGTPVKLTVLSQPATLLLGKTTVRLETTEPVREHIAFGDAIGDSPAMQQVFAMLRRLAASDITVALLGETGVGKDVLARALHAASPRARGPFAVFDCGAVAPNLIESALFGHTKGAFTGAVADRPGVFEAGHGGFVFLDEIAELPVDLQPRLLRVLEERQVRRVGAVDPIAVDVRVVCATNRNLEEEVEAGRFRQDLYFRLTGAVVHIPPLRERLEDLPKLVDRALAEVGRPLQVAETTMAALRSYDWPGNVRELKNVIASAAAFADGPVLEPRHLMFFRRQGSRQPTLDRLPLGGRALEQLERAAIKQTLEQFGGNKTRAAKALGIAASTLYEKIKKYGL
ncbi:MAG: FHA domain-containing protein [Deltaproteobacteria bacterium]|nr:MAG: FHA domain-containing protein [Deltaproteobacteria bacterium]